STCQLLPPRTRGCSHPRCSGSGICVRLPTRPQRNPSTSADSSGSGSPEAAVPRPRSVSASAASRSVPLLDTAGRRACDSPLLRPASRAPLAGGSRNAGAQPPASLSALVTPTGQTCEAGINKWTGPAPPTHQLAARSAPGALPSSRLRPRAWPQALLLFCQHRPQRLDVQRLVGHHLLQPPVLILQLPQPSRFTDFQPAVLRLPAVVRLIADLVLPADLPHRQTRFHFLQNPNDLLLAESTLPHRSSSLGFYTPENSHLSWSSFGGAGQPLTCTYTDTNAPAFFTVSYRVRAYQGSNNESENSNTSTCFQLYFATANCPTGIGPCTNLIQWPVGQGFTNVVEAKFSPDVPSTFTQVTQTSFFPYD